jgi:hypothetical protein
MARPADPLKPRLSAAIKQFWTVRAHQATKQGGDASEAKDRGERSAVTGGHAGGRRRTAAETQETQAPGRRIRR